ncbi:hypothetical protein OGA32_000119 [Salmonella enterica]|nr:hypothetical protein [Salmonella enterica]
MFTIDELRNSSTYKQSTPEEQRYLEDEYNRQNNQPTSSDRLVGGALNLQEDVNTITNEKNYSPDSDINPKPKVTPTQNIQPGIADKKAGTVEGHTWEDIVRSNTYQNASDEDKDFLRDQFYKQGGEVPTWGDEAWNAVGAAQGEIGKSVTHAVYGTGILALDFLKATNKNTNGAIFGNDSDVVQQIDQMATNSQKALSESLKRMDDRYNENEGKLTQGSALSRNVAAYAAPVTQGLAYVAAPEVMIPLGGAMAAGENRASQAPGKENPLESLAVGGINYMAGRFIPNIGLANRAENAVLNSEVVSPLVKKVLAKTAGVAVGTGEGAAVGGLTGAGVEASTELARGEDLNVENILQAGKTNAAFGGVFGGGLRAITPNTIIKVDQPTETKTKATIDQVNEAAKQGDFKARDEHLNNADAHVYSTAAENLQKHGFEPVKQAARAGEGAQEAYGVSGKEAKGKVIDPDYVKSNLEETKANLKQTADEAVAANNRFFENIEKPLGEGEAVSAESKQIDTIRNRLLKRIESFNNAYKKSDASFNPTDYRNEATAIHEDLNALHKLAPDEAEHIADNITSPITGKKGNIDFQSDAHTLIAQREIINSVQKALNRSFSSKFLPNELRKTATHAISQATLGYFFPGHIEAHIATAGVVHALQHGKAALAAKRRASQSETLAKRVEGRDKEILETPVKTTGAYTTEEGRAAARRQRTTQSAVAEAKAMFADHPEIAEKINASNFTNIKEFQDMVKVKQGVEKAKAKFAEHPEIAEKINESNYKDLSPFTEMRREKVTQQRKEARQAEREAATKQEEANHKEQVREFKEVNPHLKPFFRDAENNLKAAGKAVTAHNFERAVDQLASGKVATSTGEKIKAPFKAGSKQEFLEDVRKNKIAPDEVKAEQRALIDRYHSNLEPGKNLSPKEQQNLHRSLAEIESNFMKKHGQSNEAKLALERGEEFAKRVDIRNKIALRNQRTEELHNVIDESLKDAGISERKTKQFIKSKINELHSKEFKSQSEFNDYKEQVRKEAESLTSSIPTPTAKSTKAEPKSTPEDEGLSTTQINNIRKDYTHALTKNMGKPGFEKVLDEIEAFRESYDFGNSASAHAFDHAIDAAIKIHEGMQKGITDPQALLSQEMYNRFTGSGLGVSKYIRAALNLPENPKLLSEAARKKLADESTPEKTKAKDEKEARREKMKSLRKIGNRNIKLSGAVRASRKPSEPGTREPTRPPEPETSNINAQSETSQTRTPRKPAGI